MYQHDLEKLAFFTGLTNEQLLLIKPLFTNQDCSSGTLLFEQGDFAEYFYLVVSGEITIRYKPEDGAEIIVARVKPGGVVGWSAALGNRLYTSGAICTKHCHLLRVRGSDLRSLCDKHPDTGDTILDRLASVIAERLRSTHTEIINILKQVITINHCAR